jgi:hypothetical protein
MQELLRSRFIAVGRPEKTSLPFEEKGFVRDASEALVGSLAKT